MALSLTKPTIGSTDWGTAVNQNWTDIESAFSGGITIGPLNFTNGAGNYLRLPQLTTTERNNLTAVNGMLIYNSTTNQVEGYVNGAWGQIGGGSGGIYDVILLQEIVASGGNAGTFTAGDWRTRKLNTETVDTGGHASLSSYQISLGAGTYACFARCPCLMVDGNRARLYNIDDSSVIAYSGNCYNSYSAGYAMTQAIILCRFTLAATKVLELQHICYTTRADWGFGNTDSCTGGDQTYAQILLFREPD